MADASSRLPVAVIGAGAGGLVAAKSLLEEGQEPVVFEQCDQVGGIWNFAPSTDDERRPSRPAYQSLRANSSRQLTSFSDFPMPGNLADFPAREEVLRYLNDYADHFGLRKRVCFGSDVENVVSLPGQRWRVSYRSAGTLQHQEFRALIVCTGRNAVPMSPVYSGAQLFQGTLMHSSAYRSPEPFAGMDVVVVGAGSSAADIAVELSHVARQVTLSTAKGAWFVPTTIGGRPFDHWISRFGSMMPPAIRARVFRQMLRTEYRRMGIDLTDVITRRGLPAPLFDLARARFTPSAGLISAIAAGAVQVKPDIVRLGAQQITFTDRTSLDAHAVIFATGYTTRLPFLLEVIGDTDVNMLNLYKHVFSLQYPKLAFIGLCIVNGPKFPVDEMQARWIAQVLSGAIALPSANAMRLEVLRRQTATVGAGDPPMRIDLVAYLEDLAREIGVQPRLARHPLLMPSLLFGPLVAAQYRLDGHGRWSGAANVVRGVRR